MSKVLLSTPAGSVTVGLAWQLAVGVAGFRVRGPAGNTHVALHLSLGPAYAIVALRLS